MCKMNFSVIAGSLLILLTSCDRTPKEIPHRYEVCQCTDTNAVKENVHQFPFADDVTVVAYEYKSDGHSWIPLTTAESARLKSNGRFDTTLVRHIDTLTGVEKKQLEKLFLNRKEVCSDDYSSDAADCLYMPHHCIVFYQNDSVIAYHEICFMCEKIKCWPENYFGSQCGDFDCEMRYFYQYLDFADDMLGLEHCPGYHPDTVEIWKGRFSQ